MARCIAPGALSPGPEVLPRRLQSAMDHRNRDEGQVVRHEDVKNAVDLSELLSLAVSAATRAGEAVRAHVVGRVAHASVRATAETKSSATDLVTAADRESEQLIVDLLLSSRPDDGIVGEEGGERQGTSGIEWVIDPIDGTTNFFYGNPSVLYFDCSFRCGWRAGRGRA